MTPAWTHRFDLQVRSWPSAMTLTQAVSHHVRTWGGKISVDLVDLDRNSEPIFKFSSRPPDGVWKPITSHVKQESCTEIQKCSFLGNWGFEQTNTQECWGGIKEVPPFSLPSSLMSFSGKNYLFSSRDCDDFWVCGLVCVSSGEWSPL